jgi:hypothetical protein
MTTQRSVTIVIGFLAATTAWAGPLSDWFDRKSKVGGGSAEMSGRHSGGDPVVELLTTLQNDASASKRGRAAEELARFDSQAFPEILPALINSLQHDSSATVRREAAQALGRLKPASHEASQALDQAIANDSSPFVRLQARTSRLGYHAPAPQSSAKLPSEGSRSAWRAPLPPVNGSSLPSPATRPLPKPPAEGNNSFESSEPPKFLPDDQPRLLPPVPKEKKAATSDDSAPILIAPSRAIDRK